MRKYYNETIQKTLHTSRVALEKMVEMTFGNIGRPKKIEKNSEVEKTFLAGKNPRRKKLAPSGATT